MPTKIREIRIEGNVAFVPLTKGYEAAIDMADVPLVEGKNWFACVDLRKDGSIRTVYAARKDPSQNGKQHQVRMHRVIASTPNGMETDHRDGDGLNNRRANLRNATVAQNQYNRRYSKNSASGTKGVSWDKRDRKWRAHIKISGKQRPLGYFDTIADAAAAYATASAEFHGDFGRTA